jgi:low affinity Fe/Cu permease
MSGVLPVTGLGTSGRAGGSWFSRFAAGTAVLTGRPVTFLIATAVVVVWAVTGPVFNYSDTWQLVINTGTTIVTFLMVFLIQHTQNRDTLALQLKLDELILATKKASNNVVAIEEAPEEVLEAAKEDVRVKAVSQHDATQPPSSST